MEAVHFVKNLATGVELALVSPHPLDRRDIGLVESGEDLVAAERVVAGQWLILTQPAKLVEHADAILVGVLVALDLGELDLGTAGERSDCVLGLQAVLSGDWLLDGCGGHVMPPVVGTPPARRTGAGLAKPMGSVMRPASVTVEESR
jgi:hypothetical protein